MRYTTTTLLAIGLLTGSALTAPLPQDDFDPFSNGDGDGGGIATFSGGNPPGKRSPLPLDNSNPLGDCSDLGCIPPESHNKRSPDSLTINSDPLHDGGEAGVGNPPPPDKNGKRSPDSLTINSDPLHDGGEAGVGNPPPPDNGKRSPVPQDDFDPFGDGSDDDPSNPGKRSMTISARKDKSGPVETFRTSNEDDDPADDPNTVHETDTARKR
ncbi:hypothetical protein LZ32DRAFT_604575 [Colletotrichum eremochloae]|nr:hypothetical protein LZ32DRAFT_604575 [Colletotrichum eremochloae]